MDDGSASVFCFTPLRVPVSELAPVAACPPSHSPSSESVCSAPPLPLGPCPVCPRLEQEFEAFRQAAYWKAMHGRALQREAQLKVENERLQARTPASRAATLRAQSRDFRGNGSSGLGCAPRRLTATTAAWPATRWAQSETPRLFPPPCRCRRQGLAARPVPLLAVWSAVRRFPRHRGFHNPGDRCPGPSPSHSPSPLSTDLLVWCSSRHRHRPATGPADSQEHAGDLDLGDGALGQVSVLPADLSALGGLAQPRPGPVVGHPDRRPEADGAAVGAGVRGLGEAEPRAEAVARRRDAVASLRHARREGRLPVVSLGLSFPRGRDLHPGGRAVARRA